jgi:hypothetical protein
MLFYHIKQCQEIQTIGQDPYLAMQIINIAVWILKQSGIIPIKEFKTWAVVPNKTYPLLKTFIHEAYMRCLTAITLRNTAGKPCYFANQNIFNMFHNDNPNKQSTDDDATTVTQTAAAATSGTSTLRSTYAAMPSAAIPPEVTMAIKQLLAKQTAIMQQTALISFSPPPAQHSTVHVPPIHNVQIPMQQTGGFQQGCGGRRGNINGGRGRGHGGRHGGKQHTPFAKSLVQCRQHATLSWPDVPPRGWHSPVTRSLGNSWRRCANAAQTLP